MKTPRPITRLLLCLGLLLPHALLLSGCERLFDKGAKEKIEAAERRSSSGEYEAAVALYESALDGTEKTADLHYKLALIYADRLKSPIDALHHFGRYLVLAPTGGHAKEAQEYRKEGEQKLLIALSRGNPISQEEAARLKNDNLALRKSLAELRAQKSAPPSGAAGSGKKGEQVQRQLPPDAKTYVVQSGDTLATISIKFYKTKTRWKDIQEANFYPMEGTAKIHPGMTLAIP